MRFWIELFHGHRQHQRAGTAQYFQAIGLSRRHDADPGIGLDHEFAVHQHAVHPTGDGWLYLQAQTQPFWEALCELTGLAHLARDPRYDDMRKLKEREDELVPALRAALATRTALQWEALFGARVPCAAVRDLGDVFEHPQVLAQGLIAEHEHPTLGHYRAVTQPLRINGRAATQPDRRAPLLGEHTDEVLHDAGLDEAEVAALRSAGVIT